jgi:predicted acylesterase/phospholipase RssA
MSAHPPCKPPHLGAPETERDLGITFAGGGNKSFYQYGLMKHWRDRLLPRASAVALCSAGACVAVLTLSGREAQIEEFWERRFGDVTRNFDWRLLLSGRSPMPHGALYRELLLHALSDDGFTRVISQPFPILTLTTAFPDLVPAPAAALLGLFAYTIDHGRRVEKTGPPFSRRVGFRPAVFDARRCSSPEELADLIIATSSTPPFTPLGTFRGRRLLDGGIIDPAPSFLLEDVPDVKRSITLLTASGREPSACGAGRSLVIAPSRDIPVRTWDFTRPDLVEAVIELGERDSELYEARLDEFLAR